MMYSRVARVVSTLILLAGCGGDGKSPVEPDTDCIRGTVTLGTVRAGTVSDTDCPFPATSNSLGHYDEYSVALAAGEVYHVRHRRTEAADWDPFVEVLDPGGLVIAFSDDDFRSFDSETFFVAPATGTYSVRAGAVYSDDFGDYLLSIRGCGATPLTSTAPMSGALTATDCPIIRGLFDSTVADVFLVTATGSPRTLTVTSGTFQPGLIVAGPGFAFEGEFLDFAIARGFPRSPLEDTVALTITASVTPGTYLVIVNASTSIMADGSYTIQSSIAGASTRRVPRP